MTRCAIVQTSPVFLDKTRTIDTAVAMVEEAADGGAELVVFTEAFIPGYPTWVWRLRPGGDWNLSEALHARLLKNAVNTDSKDLDPLYEAARQAGVTVVCGVEERGNGPSQATLYNTALIIGPDGQLMNKHRKLMPTNPERMVWGFGDATGLNVVDTPSGRTGTLICWENYMPLARYALCAQGIEIYVAPTYDSGDDWIESLRHIAREAGCWVIGSGNLLRGGDMLTDRVDLSALYPDPEEWVNAGDSVVIAPDRELIAGPLREQQGLLFADIDLAKCGAARRTLDIAGHYSRPDIFQLQVDRQSQSPAVYK